MMKTIAALPLFALALSACDPYYNTGSQPYPQGPQGYPQPGYPDPNYPQGGPPMPPGGPVYPGPGQPDYPAPNYPQPNYPAPNDPSGETSYRAIGTEPFWDLEIGRDLIFTDRGNNVSVSQPAPTPINGVAGETYQTSRLEVNIVHRQCSDGMSNRSYPDTVDVRVDGRQRYRGCGAPIAYFNETSETGQPNYQSPAQPSQPYYPQSGQPNYPQSGQPTYPGPAVPPGQPGYPGAGAPPGMPVMNLANSNWRVFSINGMRTPSMNFYLNFMPGQIGAKFGCNSLSASYSQTGNVLKAGPVAATRMACPDMTFEGQGARILERPMTVSGIGNRITLSNDRGSIELVQAR